MLIPKAPIADVRSADALDALLNTVTSVVIALIVAVIFCATNTVANKVPITFRTLMMVPELVIIYAKKSAAFVANLPT